MTAQSIWIDSKEFPDFPKMAQDYNVDVVIVGGGISGITAAKILSDQNLEVALIEGHKLAQSNSGRSTGNLYSLVDIPLCELEKKYSTDFIKKIISLREEGIDLIETYVHDFNLECDFKRVPWIRYSANELSDEQVLKDYEIAKALDLAPIFLDEGSDYLRPLRGRLGFLIQNQAQINPYLYSRGLAENISKEKCHIFEDTRVIEIDKDESNNGFIVKTQDNEVRAKYVIEMTHTPLGFSPLQTLLGPYREYGVAGPSQNKLYEPGIYWGYYEKDKVTSIRNYKRDGEEYNIVVGEPHKVGQEDSTEKIEKLITFGEKLSIMKNIAYHWGGQHFKPADYLPYIGDNYEPNRFVATGFSTDGLVYGTLSALALSKKLIGQDHQAIDLFNAERITPLKSASKFIKENLNVAKQYIRDYFKKEKLHELEPNQGQVIDYNNHKYAVSKDEKGQLHICSAVCTHLAGIVHWNNSEQSWDCPCHGSRFTRDGLVIEGPALMDLESVDLEDSVPEFIFDENSTKGTNYASFRGNE